MRLSTKKHGIVDYLLGAVLIALPWVMGFGPTTAGLTASILGAALIANTLLSNFEWGRVRAVEVPVHLWMDGVIGLLLIISPWILGFDRTAWAPHVLVGALVIVSALLTNTIPETDRRGARPKGAA